MDKFYVIFKGLVVFIKFDGDVDYVVSGLKIFFDCIMCNFS